MKTSIEPNHIVFIESNTTGTGKLFIATARKKGFVPIFITSNPDKYPYLSEILIHPIILDTNDEQSLFYFLQTIPNLKGVFSSSEYYIETACKLATKLRLPTNNPQVVNTCRNKDILAETLSSNGINCPYTLKIKSIDELQHVFSKSNIKFPVVIKPSKGTGSIGVRLCHEENEALEYTKSLLNQEVQTNQNSNIVLLQEYIAGEEYSVETISINNKVQIIGITKKHLSDEPYFVETGHDFPALLEESLENRIHEIICNSFNVLGFSLGPAHTEIRVKNNIPYIIEINPRLAGGMIPKIVKTAIGVNLIEKTIDLITGKNINLIHKKNGFSSIRFVIPQKNGLLKSVSLKPENLKTTVEFNINKKSNDLIILQGDFRDRIGYLIVKENTFDTCVKLANDNISSVTIEMMETDNKENTNENTGRLKHSLMPEVQKLINKKIAYKEKLTELKLLADIDEAHIIMLHQTKFINKNQTTLLLDEINKLRLESFASILNTPAPRGLYLLYENHFIQKLGIKIGGISHLGRSRNDINATLFKLQLKKDFFNLYQKLWQLRSTLITQAKKNFETPLPIYSQYQTALPGTLAHYYLGIENAIARDQQALEAIYSNINECPLGAGAGGGTTLQIEPSITANLLGFLSCTTNSLDAVASRDIVTRILAALSICSATLSRLTEDFQLWSTNEFKFIDFPDHLSGGSSMMPQKKNPYLLEKAKGALASLLGSYVSSIAMMQKVPFGNSVEIGTEAIKPLKEAYKNFNFTISLLTIIIKQINLNKDTIIKNQIDNLTCATYFTDILAQEDNYTFREAHHLVGEKIRHAIDSGLNPTQELLTISTHTKQINLEPLELALKMEYGGGPGIQSVTNQYNIAVKRLNEDAKWINTMKLITKDASKLRKKYSRLILQTNEHTI